ncbi:MAG: hypothetical protein U9R02_12250 [Thermodesulfobacteriota bacterium]|nr:hypothetical protein [Thermodesulfobacteriota bacterium]
MKQVCIPTLERGNENNSGFRVVRVLRASVDRWTRQSRSPVLAWFPRSSVGTQRDGMHSHAGAWERGERRQVPVGAGLSRLNRFGGRALLKVCVDKFHRQASELTDQIDDKLITTEAILIEIGNALAKLQWRELAVSAMNDLRDDDDSVRFML